VTNTLLNYLKAIAAILATILGTGILTDHWLTDTELILATVNGVVVALTPNVGSRVAVRGTTVRQNDSP